MAGRTWLQGPQAPRPGPVGQVDRWCETVVAFAGEKWAFLVQFLGAKVMAVSAAPCWGCAVVLLVSMSPCFCVLCAVFFALLGLMRVRARKSSPCVLTMAKSWRLMARWASRSSPVEWCNRFVSFGVGYALSWSGVSSCWVGWGVSRDLVRTSRLR